MERNVKEEMCRGKRSTISELIKKIEDVSTEEVNVITQNYLKPDKFVLTVLGEKDNVNW